MGRRHGTPPIECVRLLAAVIWVIDPERRCDASWEQARHHVFTDIPGFVQKLVEWQPLRDASPARLGRARELLLQIWGWVAMGCSGSSVLRTLFAWVSLVV